MSSQQAYGEAQQPRRLALFVGVFIAGIIGGVAMSGSFARAPQARPMVSAVQVGTVATSAEVTSASSDPSVPDAGTVLRPRRNGRPEAAAPTF